MLGSNETIATAGIIGFYLILSTVDPAQAFHEWNPPEEYDHPFPGKLYEYPFPQRDVMELCQWIDATYYDNDRPLDPYQKGCAMEVTEDVCIIVYISETVDLVKPEDVRRHEIGHCNGWPKHHPE